MVVHFYYKIRNVHVYNVNYEIERAIFCTMGTF